MEIKGYNTEISPIEFEKLVKDYFLEISGTLKNFKATHNVRIKSFDGDYQIDVFAEFEALGTEIRVLVECKKHKNKIKRETVQVLFDKLRATGSHKGIIFATSGFQSGAEKFAKEHGIALINVIEGKLTVGVKSAEKTEISEEYLKFFEIPKYVGEYNYSDNGICYLQKGYLETLEDFIYDK
ncbi:restriction endonuclease [Frigoriflavimonas asaccharolytica]|uniref:Restriction system protein n=1 Tax=Frigoriflavimonas asaccharolytica TaxID=2735899 RepID=A0A8J8KAT4_9FLAO|nr:restriction endonuclease [Frigoriflavimonas asaccharolytica]NRS91804.1 restriction system protein [Frigoriflavimonas asaccharolytica]